MVFLGELRIEAKIENLRTVSHFIQAIGGRLNLIEKTLHDIDLAVDEAATNIMHHAYPDEPGPMVIAAETSDDTVQITMTDWGVPFDPRNVRPFDLSAPIETRIQGGMGLFFIHNLMDSVSRTSSTAPGEPNTLILSKRIERMPPGTQRPTATQELNAILNVSQVMATAIDLDQLLTRIINEAVSVIDAEGGTLYLVDEKTRELVSHVLIESEGRLHEVRVRVGEGIAGEVAATGKTLNVHDVSQHPKFNPVFDDMTGYTTQTMLVAPMRDRQKNIIGVVQLINKRRGRFTSRDERLLTAMAAQAAISIENARLYAQEIERQLINQELETARSIQKSFLPQAIPQHDSWDIAAYWRPMREVAGDFYDFYLVPDGRLAVVIADVSGKGVPAALFMALSVTVLRFAMSLGLTPGEMMDHANHTIIKGQQSRMFTTAFVGYLDCDSGVVQFASAGHNPPLLYKDDSGEFEYLDAPGVAMGVFKEARFIEERINVSKGDVLVLYTDGITEVINDEEEEFGEGRLEEVIQHNSSRSAQEIVDAIIATVSMFADEQGAYDDETLIVIKRLA